MTFEEYQNLARRTMNMSLENRQRLTMTALGLAGEAGECSEAIKKHIFHGHSLDRDVMRDELGDVLWYLAMLADACGLQLDAIAAHNVDKLRARYPDGFSSHASINRGDNGTL